MGDKNMLLIKTIEKFPCLYNFNLVEYSRKDVSEKAWAEVSNETKLSVAECKEKWKNLRYGFVRSLRPNPGGAWKKKYYLHDDMAFILPFVRLTKQNETITQPMDDDTDDDSNEIVNEIGHNTLQHHEIDIQHSSVEPPKKRAKLYDHSYNNHSHQKSTVHYENNEEPRRLFLLSLLPEVMELTDDQMKFFRRKVLTLIDDITDQDIDMNEIQWRHERAQRRRLLDEGIKSEPL